MKRTIEPMRRKDRPKESHSPRLAEKRAALARKRARKGKGSQG